jgi:hypothetical protein
MLLCRNRRSMIRCHKWHIGADEAHCQSFADFHPDRVRRRIGAAVDGEIIRLSAGGNHAIILPAAGSSRVAVQPWPIGRFQEVTENGFHGRSLLLDSQPFSRQVSINRSDQFTDPGLAR